MEEPTSQRAQGVVSPTIGCIADSTFLSPVSPTLIAEQWIKRLQAGSICFHSSLVGTRWVASPDNTDARFQLLLNESRKQRLNQ
jgi:hypothetical protein